MKRRKSDLGIEIANLKRRKQKTVYSIRSVNFENLNKLGENWSQQLQHMQQINKSQEGRARRNKPALLTQDTRHNCTFEFREKVQFEFMNWGNVWSVQDVHVYGQTWKYHFEAWPFQKDSRMDYSLLLDFGFVFFFVMGCILTKMRLGLHGGPCPNRSGPDLCRLWLFAGTSTALGP